MFMKIVRFNPNCPYSSTIVLWVIRTLPALGIKDFCSVLLGILHDVTAPPIDLLKPCNYVTNLALTS